MYNKYSNIYAHNTQDVHDADGMELGDADVNAIMDVCMCMHHVDIYEYIYIYIYMYVCITNIQIFMHTTHRMCMMPMAWSLAMTT